MNTGDSMRKISVWLTSLAVALCSALPVKAVEFQAKGEWGMYFSTGNSNLVSDRTAQQSGRSSDKFDPSTRLRLQLDAIASESLSGTVYFEIGPTAWGKASQGAALGTDGTTIEVKRAYLDWIVPNTQLSWRMGLQGVAMPYATFGPAVLSEGNESAAIMGNWRINDTVGLTFGWLRPYNDNFAGRDKATPFAGIAPANYLDNMDLFTLSVPVRMDGITVTPWVLGGIMGQNTLPLPAQGGPMRFHIQSGILPRDAYLNADHLRGGAAGANFSGTLRRNRDYGTLFWAGLPVTITALDPWNIEFDLNYGYSSGVGSYDDPRVPGRRNDTRREGWLVRALVEYKTEWAVPGLYAWYSSGDDGNTRNGSEVMPSVAPGTGPTSFGMDQSRAEGNITYFDALGVTVAGTWGVGARLKQLSFLDDLSHTLQATYYRGTNDPAMAKSMEGVLASQDPNSVGMGWTRFDRGTSIYMTRNDYMVEFNLDSEYKIYDNLKALLYLGYIINGMDKDTWKWHGNQKEDGWRATLMFVYNF